MKKNIKEDAKRVVLPNAKDGLEKKNESEDAKNFISAMSSEYDVNDFWDAMGMIIFTSKNNFTINEYPYNTFKFYIVYSNVNHKLSIRYKINEETEVDFAEYGHGWLDAMDVMVGSALNLIEESGFLPPSIERISEINGDDIFDNLREDLRKLMDKDGEEEPTNIVKLNENKVKQIVFESLKRLLKESDNEYDYDGNYWQLIKNEYHNLCILETKVPYHLKGEIHSMATKLQGMLSDIERMGAFSSI